MDIASVVQRVGECKEVVGVEEVVTVKIVDDLRYEAFLERVFIARGVITISAIGIKSNPGG